MSSSRTPTPRPGISTPQATRRRGLRLDSALALALALTAILTPAARADNDIHLALTATRIDAGQTLDVFLVLDFDDVTLGGGVQLAYDPDVFEVDAFTLDPMLGDDPSYRCTPTAGPCAAAPQPGLVPLVFGHFDGLSGQRGIATVRLRGIADGLSPIALLPNPLSGGFVTLDGDALTTGLPDLTYLTVPEPGPGVLLGWGALGLIGLVRRRGQPRRPVRSSRRVVLLSLVAVVALSASKAWSIDSDGDLVADGTDNCSQRANPTQRDTDQDGFGNGCDPDFDQDGTITDSDRAYLEQRLFGVDQLADLDEDGRVNFADLGRLRAAIASEPGPGAAPTDEDGDGTLDLVDACAASPGLGRPVARGCNFVDFTRDSGRLLTDTPISTVKSLRSLVSLRGGPIETQLDVIDAVVLPLSSVAALLDQGDACAAASLLDQTSRDLGTATRTLDTYVRNQLDVIYASVTPPTPVPGVGVIEFHGYDYAYMPFEKLSQRAHRAVAELDASAAEAQLVCDELEDTGSLQGYIVDYDPIDGTLELDDGQVIGLLPGHSTAGQSAPLVAGILVDVLGPVLRDGTFVAATVSPAVSGLAEQITIFSCMKLKVVPVQPSFGGPQLVHDAEAYLADGRLRLEHRMRLVVDDSACPTGNPPAFEYQHYAWISLGTSEYMLKDDGSSLLLTPSMLSSFDLHFTPFVTKCYPSLPIGPGADCSVPTSFPTQSYPVSLAETGAYCDLVYDRDVLYLDAPTSSGYNGAVLSNKSLHGVSAANFSPTLANALGWGMHNDISTYPTIERIDQGEGFAVYGWDFGDGWESPVSDEKRYKEHGALGRNGLIWPAIEGVNQGRPFRYACELPDPVLVRDGISSCGPFEEPTFYTAPIDALVEISQGPGGSFSHQLSQAWDIPVSVNTLVRAARAGEVFFVRESSNQNCTSLPVCQNQGIVGNGVRIVHADGTWANYWHFRQNGSFVSEGDWVARGEVIGASGNTGFSTGPHLHFETVRQVANVPVSSESSFYAKDWSGFPFGAPQVKACWEPVQGNVMDAIP